MCACARQRWPGRAGGQVGAVQRGDKERDIRRGDNSVQTASWFNDVDDEGIIAFEMKENRALADIKSARDLNNDNLKRILASHYGDQVDTVKVDKHMEGKFLMNSSLEHCRH